MKSYTLNSIGQQSVIETIKYHCTEATIGNLARGQYSWFEAAEFDVNENGSSFEIGRQYSTSENPVNIDCPIEWFDIEEIEE
jgi:hypothetical protein